MESATLAAVVDSAPGRAAEAAAPFGCAAYEEIQQLKGKVDAAVVAVPTIAHAEVGCALLEAGIDVLVEKPIAPDLASADRLIDAARRRGRMLQIGHLERYNPAVSSIRELVKLPLFFEIHRLSLFTPRSLDVDVVLDLMIHDLDILLSLTGSMPDEIRAAGLSILSSKVDIANVRLAFPGGCIANLTASRVSTEKVRKLRFFQPNSYISIDYSRQDGVVCSVSGERQIGFRPIATRKEEPLRLELEDFVRSVRTRTEPQVSGQEARKALEVALAILDKIEEHSKVVAESLSRMN